MDSEGLPRVSVMNQSSQTNCVLLLQLRVCMKLMGMVWLKVTDESNLRLSVLELQLNSKAQANGRV